MDEALSKTPINVSEFEREQLRFFLSEGDLAATLTELNPSLAWLSVFSDLNLQQKNEAAIAVWIAKNLDSESAIREVVANIHLFKTDSVRVLEHQLNAQREVISPLLKKCWQLIIRHIQNEERGRVQNEWFDILPRIKRGDVSPEVLMRITQVLTPRLSIEKRYGWYDTPDRKIAQPTDILSIKYRVGYGVSEKDFFTCWPSEAPADAEAKLIGYLTAGLNLTLADAIEVGVESNSQLSITDMDVPSVAAHEQNAYREGFLPIVRVMAELWSRLVKKDNPKACNIVVAWLNSDYRLIHRLALYAAADPMLPPDLAAQVLLHVPAGELFLTHSRVEVHRLLRARWSEFSPAAQAAIEQRILEGPPADWLEGSSKPNRLRDRFRFELLLDLEQSGAPLGDEALAALNDIRRRHPDWRSGESERAGFTVWQGRVTSVVGDKEKLSSTPSDKLIEVAQKVAAEADLMDGDSWQDLSQSDPTRAYLGIEDARDADRWHEWAWRPVLWAAADKISDVATLNRIAGRLAQWPDDKPFDEALQAAAFWLDKASEKLKASVLWKLWDLIERRAPRRELKLDDDPFTTALNDAAGHLASVLLKRTPRPKNGVELGKQLRERYDQLATGGDSSALLARVYFAQSVAFLFERAPDWTTKNLIPSFSWSSPDASAMWSARKYSGYIGSPKLFELTKTPFLEMFSRQDAPDDNLRTYSEWLAVILLANQAGKVHYELTPKEVRSVLRRSQSSSLASFAHRLAIEMEAAKADEKLRVWTEIVGPVFQRAWPLDSELQYGDTTFKLVQILLATGAAFSDAAKAIIPFLRPEDPRHHTTAFSIAEADEDLYAVDPRRMLELLSAVAGDAPPQTVYGLNKALQKITANAPHLAQTKAYQRLSEQATPY